ncbi:Uncharacterised protein [uncultured archaeon]|nr:Uncharacterised protein [uncultured archaeon]
MGDEIQIGQDITLQYLQNKFFKENVAENQTFLVSIGLQIRAAKIIVLHPMKLSLNKPVTFVKDEVCVILKPESLSIRIVGSGSILT